MPLGFAVFQVFQSLIALFLMSSRNSLLPLASIALMLLIAMPVHSALNEDEGAPAEPTPLDQVVKKVTGKKTPAKPAKVNSNDLMKAMQDSIVAAPAPAAPAAAATPLFTPAPATPSVAPPVQADLPVKLVTPVKKDSYTAPTAPSPAADAPAAAPHEGGVVLYEQKDSEGKTISPSSVAAPDVKKEEPPAEAKAAPDSGGAPLLSDMAEPPSLMDGSTPKAPLEKEARAMAPAEPAPAPHASAPVEDGFSAPRPLFSAPDENSARPGIVPSAPPAARVEAPVTDRLPPVTLPSSSHSSSSPPVAAGASEGVVLHSQTADENPAGQSEATEKKSTESEPPVEAFTSEMLSETPEPAQEEPVAAMEPVEPLPPPAAAVHSGAVAVQGSCGAVNGIGTPSMPISGLCTQGTPSEVTGEGPWSWNCRGENGGATASCAAPLQINGECGMANGSQSAAAPIGGLCGSGKASDVSGDGPWHWNCFGDNGGVVAQCVAYTLVSGRCGTAHNVPTGEAPTNGLCASGKESGFTGEGPWMWNCAGSGEGTTVSCMAPVLRQGACGPVVSSGAVSMPTDNLCATGTPTPVTGTGPWTWSCTGEGGGGSVNCTVALLTSGACGAAHGVGATEKPREGLCNSGSVAEVTGDGPWNWTCFGENGGAMVNCMAPKKLDGICGASHLAGANAAPAEGLCNAGAPGPVLGSGPWQWTCEGAGGGITANCVANPLTNAACGVAHGLSTSQAPISDLCAAGTPTSVIGGGPWMWSCEGAHGGSPVNCMAPMQVNATCGAADNAATPVAPAADLCRNGKASAVSGNGPWTWTCQGAGGGMSVSCQAPMQTAAQTPAPAVTPAAHVPKETAKAGNECTPSVKRWTITCQQGGYPANYTGVIVGETQVLCPTGVERGVWLSNSCAPATDSAPVSPSPGVLLTPPSPKLASVADTLPDIAPLPAKALEKPRRLETPRFGGAGVAMPMPPGAAREESIRFAAASEGLDAQAIGTLGLMTENMQGDTRSIITLNAYAAMPADNNQQEARRVALARALAVRSYLMRKGIASNRIDIRALGPASDGRGDDRVDISIK